MRRHKKVDKIFKIFKKNFWKNENAYTKNFCHIFLPRAYTRARTRPHTRGVMKALTWEELPKFLVNL